MAENSGHIIQYEQPELVTEKLLELVRIARQDQGITRAPFSGATLIFSFVPELKAR
jgi:hypothetical protein